jgi:hypothetical protein
MTSLRHRAIRASRAVLLIALGGLAGGCSYSNPTALEVHDESAADLKAVTATPGATTQPAATRDGPDERQREIDEASTGWFGFVAGTKLRAYYAVADLADTVSGAPARYGQQLASKDDPDARREGIMGLVDRPWGQTPTYTVAYARIAEDDRQDPLVRASALRALNRARVRRFTPLYVKDLADPSELVRLEACKALNRMPDANAVPDLIKLVGRAEEGKDVRIAAAEALRHYKRVDVARALVGLLGEREFGIAWQAQFSLRDVTGRNLGYDESKWLGYLSSPDKDKPLG